MNEAKIFLYSVFSMTTCLNTNVTLSHKIDVLHIGEVWSSYYTNTSLAEIKL